MVVSSKRFIIGNVSGVTNKRINFKALRISIQGMVQSLWGITAISNLQIFVCLYNHQIMIDIDIDIDIDIYIIFIFTVNREC